MITIDYIGRGVQKNQKSDYVILDQPLSDRWQVTHDMWHLPCDMWHLTREMSHMTFFFFFIRFWLLSVFVAMLPSSHVERFSVSRMQALKKKVSGYIYGHKKNTVQLSSRLFLCLLCFLGQFYPKCCFIILSKIFYHFLISRFSKSKNFYLHRLYIWVFCFFLLLTATLRDVQIIPTFSRDGPTIKYSMTYDWEGLGWNRMRARGIS